MFQLDTFRLSMNRYHDCFVQRKNLKIISAYPNFHIFRRHACFYHCFFPEIRFYARIYHTCIQILASPNLPGSIEFAAIRIDQHFRKSNATKRLSLAWRLLLLVAFLALDLFYAFADLAKAVLQKFCLLLQAFQFLCGC